MRGARIAVVVAVSSLACFDGAPTFPESSPVQLESTPLLSGGEGVLVSEAYDRFFLKALLDESGAVIERRWVNFRVEVDGIEVDSWRIDNTRIGFRVPVSSTGTYAIDIIGTPHVFASLSERVLGSSSSTRLNDPCVWSNTPQIIPIGPDLIWGGTACILDDVQDIVQYGYASMHPSVPGAGMNWIEGATALMNFVRAPTGAGQSYDVGRIVFQQPNSFNADVESYVWRVGATYEPLEPITCLPAGIWSGAAIC